MWLTDWKGSCLGQTVAAERPGTGCTVGWAEALEQLVSRGPLAVAIALLSW